MAAHSFMKKEVVIAILIGLLLGLIITVGFYRARQPKIASNSNLVNQATPLPEAGTGKLSLLSPEDGLVTTNTALTIAGSTEPNSFVVIFVDNKELITTADATGNFSVQVTLTVGSNSISVYAVDEDGQKAQLEHTVVVEATPQEAATDDTDSASTSAKKES